MANSSTPNKKKAMMALAGNTPQYSPTLENAEYNANGRSSAQSDKQRAVCRVYISGTGLEYICSHMLVHSINTIIDLSASSRPFGSETDSECNWIETYFHAAVDLSRDDKTFLPIGES